MKSKLTAGILVMLLYAILCGAAFAQDTWPTFHQNDARTGAAGAAALNTLILRPTWVFPYPEKEIEPIDDGDIGFAPSGAWTVSDPGLEPSSYNDDYLWTVVEKPQGDPKWETWQGPWAAWSFDFTILGKPAGWSAQYFVYVWFPSSVPALLDHRHTRDAHYIVYVNGTVAGRYTLDQSGGGAWINLGNTPFRVDYNDVLQVRVTNETQDEDSDGKAAVIADAVKVVQDSGTILSSPVLDTRDILVAARIESRPLDATPGQDGSRNVGVVYGIATEDDPATFGTDDRGFPLWRFPDNLDNWIEGGFSSTPAIATVSGTEAAVIPAHDGQVYVISTDPAASPRLIAQGPGIIEENESPTGSWVVGTHSGYQGTDYLQAPAVMSGGSTVSWSVSVPEPGAYAVYAWIPPSTTSQKFIPDAHYEVTWGSEKLDVKISQTNGGAWARIGYLDDVSGNVRVELDNTTLFSIGAGNYYVAADALKIVRAPKVGDRILDPGSFDFSSPIVDGNTIYVGCTNGRLYALEVRGSQLEVKWAFPDWDKSPLGLITASPALKGGTLYIGTGDGHVYAVNSGGGTKGWVYPGDGQAPLGEISSTTAVDNLIYVGVGGAGPSIPGMSGTASSIIALTTAGGLAWTYTPVTQSAAGFLHSSPALLLNPMRAMVIGGTDGYLYGLNPDTGAPLWRDVDNLPVFPSLGNPIWSSPAVTATSGTDPPGAYVGTLGAKISCVELSIGNPTTSGTEIWGWNLLGSAVSSPAICNHRVYIGDLNGYTWAFGETAGPNGGGNDEQWNLDVGAAPPTSGSEAGTGGRKQDALEMEAFTKSAYRQLLNDLVNRKTLGNGRDPDLHKEPLGFPDPNEEVHQYEWGEDICIIVWNLLDPFYVAGQTTPVKPGDPDWDAGGDGVPDKLSQIGAVKVTFMSEGGGTAEERTIAKNDISYFLDKNDVPVYYAKCVYSLDGSAGNKTQTPGSRIVVNASESPSAAHRADAVGSTFVPRRPADMTTPKADRKRQFFGINNPLGLVYLDPDFSQANTVRIGVETDGRTTKRNSQMASVNGNTGAIPFVRPEPTAHGTTSSLREVVVCDRSLLGSSNTNISKFRVERKDLRWTSTPIAGYPFQPIPLWEVPPPAQAGLPNISPDYPDISARQTSCMMESNGMDPAQEVVELIAAPVSAADPRPVGMNGMGITITVPRFQPANLPRSDTEPDRQASGYLGIVYAYVDSNNNGHLDKPSATARAAMQMRTSGGSSEAYREFVVQTHVPVDRRIELDEKVIDIGQVPHGFGVLPNPQGPTAFLEDLTANVSGVPANPGMFESWFKEFHARNIGNTNLWNLRFATYVKPPQPYQEYWLGLTSDTVQDGYGGYFIPGRWVVTALDDLFLDDVPPLVNVPGAKRTFHKPRVGEEPTGLRIPDVARWYGGPVATVPRFPALSVAVPVGQPVGTYHGKFTLFEDDNQDGKFDLRSESVGNPIVELVISTTEARMTDGFTAGALPHIDVGPPPHDTGDMTAAAYRDPMTGNLHMFWASSRYATQSLGLGPETTQPWYLYRSTLPWRTDPTGGGWWEFANPGQWWQPVDPSGAFPAPASLDTLFLGSMVGPSLGAPGKILANSVKFTSPSVTIDEYSGKSWLFFSGQAYKESDTLGPGQDKAVASRVFYTEIEDGRPVGQGYTSTKDWTMPKLGVRGQASRIDGAPWLWSFWYGGSNDRWKIFYNVNPEPDNEDAWTNEALLPVPKGLTSVAEPSPIFRWSLDLKTRDVFDVVYTGYSSFHKNSDIYLSRFKPGTQQASQRSGGHWPLSLQRLPPRMRRVPIGNTSRMGEELARDAMSAVWYSRDVDWWYSPRPAWDADDPDAPNKQPDFRIFVYPDRHDPNVSLKINIGPYSKDQASGTLTFTYDDPSLVDQRTQFRAVVIDPAAGTVRFVRSPGKNALVFLEKYYPRAYRLTTDDAADVSPFAVLDDDPNPRYNAGKQNNPFFLSGNWDPDDPPATDRLWVLWRRPGLDKPGTGIHYKTFRYMVQLDYQMACSPLTGPIVQNVAGTKAALKEPVEIDWVRNRLYFTSEDASDSAGAGVTIPKQVAVTYVDATGVTRTDELHYVEFTEEMGLRGSAFGNLTRLMVNEGQISAFKDPMENKVWAFWTSTRSGNTDIYYEALSPRFHGVEY